MWSLAGVLGVITGTTLPVFLTGGLSVQLRADLGFGEAALGLAVAAFFSAAAVSSAVLGRLAERLGPLAASRLSAVAAAGVLLGVGAAARDFTTLLVLLACGGAANALGQPAANLFIARTIPQHRLGIAFAIKQSGIPAATLLAGLAVPAFALTVGWRWAFAVAALVPLGGAAALAGRGGRRSATGTAGAGEVPVRRLSMPPLVVLAAGIGLGSASAVTLGAFLVNSAVAAGMSEAPAGLLVSVGSAIGIGARLVVGGMADRRDGGHLRVTAWMLVAGCAAYVLYATQIPVLLVVATPLAFGAGWGWPGLFNLAIVRRHPHAAATASGITQTGTYIGAMAGPVVFGVLVEQASYGVAWLMAGALALAGAGAMIVGRRMLLRERAREEETARSSSLGERS